MSTKFEQHIDAIKREYESLQSRADSLHRLLETFNANDEIRKANERAEQIRMMSLHVFTKEERAANDLFCKKHIESCQLGGRTTVFEYIIYQNGIGPSITVRCPVCGEEKDITDYSCW